ncbi:hypothetical protein GCM10027060_18870 [Nesterenkonia halophila]|uniref:hypothetical protein n=1 Tax=Nesterenkonia halophila TaxID=302044 RepID=UPI0012916185|nr:hypothetical protein [Nesterenkonia halophila]
MTIYYSTYSKGLGSATGEHEEPLPTEVPRDDLEAAEHGGAPKSTPPGPLPVDRSSVHLAQMFAEKSRADLLAEKLRTAETDVRKLRKMVKDARQDAGRYRHRLRATEVDLETAQATIAHLRGIADVVTEGEAA